MHKKQILPDKEAVDEAGMARLFVERLRPNEDDSARRVLQGVASSAVLAKALIHDSSKVFKIQKCSLYILQFL